MKKNKNLPTLIKVHKIVGLFVCLVLIHLSVTGIILNHTDKLNLNQTKISWDWLLKAYGIGVPETQAAFAIDEDFFHQTNYQIFMNTRSITRVKSKLVGVIDFDDQFIVSTTENIILVNKLGEFIKKIKLPKNLIGKINKIGPYSNGIIIEINKNKFVSDRNIKNWEPINNPEIVEWSTESKIPEDINNQIKAYYVGEGISIEQIILDLHSGVIFKGVGKLFMDIIALLLILMSVSGGWIWFVKKTK